MAHKSSIILDVGGGSEGHRQQYYAFLSGLLNGERVPFAWRVLPRRQPMLVSSIEDSLAVYTIACLLRSLLGLRTAGILFRPLPTLTGTSWRTRVKRTVLRILRRVPGVWTLTILPFSVEPRFAEIATDWFYDPQFWDLHAEAGATSPPSPGPLASEVAAAAQGRRVCSAIGRQDRDKGFDQFARTWLADEKLRGDMLFAFGGKVDAGLQAAKEAIVATGALAYDRFITDDELFDIYASSDLIWCSYAADYDQASGVFGRAMQMGLPVVVRKGSLIHRFCISEALPHIAFDDQNPQATLGPIPERVDAVIAGQRAHAMGQESRQRLLSFLGLS